MFGSISFGGLSQSSPQAGVTRSGDAGVKTARQEEKQQVLPVTIRSIELALAAPRVADTNELQFFGCTQPSSVIVVAVVETLARQTTSIEMVLNDGTGRIKARYFATDMANDRLDRITAGTYVNVVGGVRSAPEVHLGLLCARPVLSADEVSYHLIECAHAALKLQRGVSVESKRMDNVVVTPAKVREADASLDIHMTPQKQVTPIASVQPTASQQMPALRNVVADIMQRDAPAKGDVGLSFSELSTFVRQMRNGQPVVDAELRKVLSVMVDEADIYATIDDDHFAPL